MVRKLLLLASLASSAVAEGGCSTSGWVRSECRPSLSRHQLRRSLSSARDFGARSLGARSLGARSLGGGSTRRDDAPLRDPASREAAWPLTRLAPLLRGRRPSASGAPLPPRHAGAMRLRGGSGAVSLDGASPMVRRPYPPCVPAVCTRLHYTPPLPASRPRLPSPPVLPAVLRRRPCPPSLGENVRLLRLSRRAASRL